MARYTYRYHSVFRQIQMEVIIPIPLEWGLWSEQGTCLPLCSHLKCIWRSEQCNSLIINSWHLPVTTQHGVRHLLLWSLHLRSLRAIHIPGLLSRAADKLSRAALPAEWRVHPQTVQQIWRYFGLAQVDLFASPEISYCQLFYSLTEGTLGTDALAHSWPRGFCKYAFPPVSLLAQKCKIREDEEQMLGWSEGCLPPPSKSMPTTTPWKGSRWGSMTGSSGSLGGQEG